MPQDHRGSSSTNVALAPHPRKRAEQLRELIDHCTKAREIADAQGEKFLSYMLAMTLQAAQGVQRGIEPT